MASELQSHRVTESQAPKGTQYTGGWNFFVPDFSKLLYSLHLQGDNTKMAFLPATPIDTMT